MSARTHVCVALLLASFSTAGCLFGGGAKKRVPEAAAAAGAAPTESDHGEIAAGAIAARTDINDGAADSVAEPAPRDSAVIWPDPESLRLSDAAPGVSRREMDADSDSQPAHRSDGSVRSQEQAVRPAPAEVVEPAETEARDVVIVDQGDAPRPPVDSKGPAGAAVANRELNLSEPTVTKTPRGEGEAELAAASGGADELSRRMAQRLRDNPNDLAVHLDYQLLRYLNDEPVPDLNAIDGLPGEDRELLLTLIDGLSNFRNAIRSDANMLLSAKIRPLLELALRLRSQADLSIKKIALCDRVLAFGNYKPMPARFVAGRENAALVYCELGNVSSRQNGDGEWESTLGQEAVLYTGDGQPIWSNPQRSVPDRSRSRRQDFFVAQQISLPANLGIGRYILKVTVYDEQVKRLAEATMPIDIVAQLAPPRDPEAGDRQSPTTGRSRKARPAEADGGPVVRKSTNALARELRAARTASERQQPDRGGDDEQGGAQGGASEESDEAYESDEAELGRRRDAALRGGGARNGARDGVERDEAVE